MKWLIENIKTLFFAIVIAVIIRSLLIQPFYIPSSSMEPSLLVGDRLFVSKMTYGYSKHSFPFSPPVIINRIFFTSPERGDVVVFKTPADNRTDYIKRVIGLPGDIVQFIEGDLYINNIKIQKTLINKKDTLYCGSHKLDVSTYNEKLQSGKVYQISYRNDVSLGNTQKYKVPLKHYFFLGDNRDCSKDSRFLSEVGYVHQNNLVGKAQILFFSSNPRNGSIFNFLNWDEILRFKRFLKKII